MHNAHTHTLTRACKRADIIRRRHWSFSVTKQKKVQRHPQTESPWGAAAGGPSSASLTHTWKCLASNQTCCKDPQRDIVTPRATHNCFLPQESAPSAKFSAVFSDILSKSSQNVCITLCLRQRNWRFFACLFQSEIFITHQSTIKSHPCCFCCRITEL